MKKTTTILFILFLINLYGQSYKVIYKVKPTENYEPIAADKHMKKKMDRMNKQIFEVAKDFKYILKFNANESIYTFQEPMKPEFVSNIIFYMACMSGGNKDIYQNKKENITLLKTKFKGRDILEKNKLELDWQITKEQGKIGKYKVIKASKDRAVAWFTPDIPVPFGPKGAGGLPGLILKYEFGPRVIYADKIIKGDFKIERPEGPVKEFEELKKIRLEQLSEDALKHSR